MRAGTLGLALLAAAALLAGAFIDRAGGARPAQTETPAAVVWAVGDGATGLERSKRLARRIVADKPDRFLYLGDVYEDGTSEEFEQNYDPLYGELAGRTAPTPGNHDWPSHAEGYDVYWSKQHGGNLSYYYEFATGGWQIIGLNSEMEHGSGSPQVAWLRSKVKGKGTCRLAFWHRARYSAGYHHGDDPGMQPFWDALKGRAAIVVNGHEHDMQRFKPRDGITEFVSGAGGHSSYAADNGRSDLAFAKGGQPGALRLELSPGLAAYRFVTVQGRTLDSGKVRCKRS